MRLAESYAPRDFVVQYSESDHAFVSRLAEHLGISFYFLHGEDASTLVFTDHTSGSARQSKVRSRNPLRAHAEERGVFQLTARHRVVPAYYAVRDYNYRTPLLDLTGEHQLPSASAGG